MTIPRFFGCSRRADDHLDQTLNAWVAGEHELPASDLAADALDFHRWAEDARRTESAATGPAADTWNRVLRHTAQAESRGGDMSSVTIGTPERASAVRDERVWDRQSIHRYVNYAASLLIVFGVAFAGAFMVMQINQPGGSNGPFAMLGQTDSASCDVEPMTVDEVMAIVENPYSAYDLKPGAMVVGFPLNVWDELAEPVDMRVDLRLLQEPGSVPTTDSFDSATDRLDSFLGCLQVGNVGQIFRFFLPTEVQRIVLSNYPVFRDEEQVRNGVEEILSLPASRLGAPMSEAISDPKYIYSANPEITDAVSFPVAEARIYDSKQLLLVGTRITDMDGNVVFEYSADGTVDPVGHLKTTDRMRVLMTQSMFDDEWYVLATIPE